MNMLDRLYNGMDRIATSLGVFKVDSLSQAHARPPLATPPLRAPPFTHPHQRITHPPPAPPPAAHTLTRMGATNVARLPHHRGLILVKPLVKPSNP